MQTSIVIVSGSVINAYTVHLNGIWHLIWRYISKPALGGHPVLSGHYSIARGCPLNTGFTILRLEHKQNSFRIRIYSFGIKTINTFIHSRSSHENHTRFQTIMGKVYTRFQIKIAQWGGTYLYNLYKGVSPPGVFICRCACLLRILQRSLELAPFFRWTVALFSAVNQSFTLNTRIENKTSFCGREVCKSRAKVKRHMSGACHSM